MPNYYTNFSTKFKLPEAAAKYLVRFKEIAENGITDVEMLTDEDREIYEELVKNSPYGDLGYCGYGGLIETGPDGEVYVRDAYGGGDIEMLVPMLQHIMEKFQLSTPIAFEWANTCDKPEVDAFGGGAAIITMYGSKIFTTAGWVETELAELNAPATDTAAEQAKQLLTAAKNSLHGEENRPTFAGVQSAINYIEQAISVSQKAGLPSEDLINALKSVRALMDT